MLASRSKRAAFLIWQCGNAAVRQFITLQVILRTATFPYLTKVTGITIYRLSERALTLAWPREISFPTHQRVLYADQLIREKPFRGWIENVPSYHTLTVYYDPVLIDIDLHAYLAALAALAPQTGGQQGKCVEIPVYYNVERAPDLVPATAALGITVEELVQLHSAQSYRVFMLGFMPGFPYLGLLPEALELPRKTTPALRVPAGTVAIAGKQTGIYPSDSPGGWWGIGWTPVKLFENGTSLLAPGDEVKFIPQWV